MPGPSLSVQPKRWRLLETPEAVARQLAGALDVPPVVAALLAQRGITDPAEAERHLRPLLRHISDPFAVARLDQAVDRLVHALRGGEAITIVGDYDVDGVTSTALLTDLLRRLGASPRYFVPRRLDEGYGLSEAALERALEAGQPDLLVALDCGTNSVEEVASLRARGIDVLIVDHHRSKEATPTGVALVNPHVSGQSDAPWGDCCTVGLVFKLAHGLLKRLRAEGDAAAAAITLRDYLDFVALGTVADLVPLRDENRLFTRYGLEQLSRGSRPGLAALMQVAGLEPGQPLETADIAFRLGPRINACGRLADAAVPVELLLADDYRAGLSLARELDAHNRERQAIERAIYEAAREQALAQSEAAALVVHGADWHPGVVGIVAGKLAKEFMRPCLALGGEGDAAKGSGRSLAGIDLQEALADCDSLLTEWGGHPMAVGVTLCAADVPALRAAFAEAVHARHPEPLVPELTLAAWVEAVDLSEELVAALDALRPFGQACSTPILGVRGARLAEPAQVFANAHARFRVLGEDGRPFSTVAWRFADRLPPSGRPLELAVRLGWNRWQGRCEAQAELLDWR